MTRARDNRIPRQTVQQILLAWLLLVCAPLATAAAAELETEHYRIVTDGADADAMINEVGRMLEQAWVAYVKHFGCQPELETGEKLGVFFADKQQDFHREMARNGLPHIEGGGYYAPDRKIAYAWRQPQEYDTRALIIHECAHQFHFLACCNNRNPQADWFIEGCAEYLSNHLWDGTTLTCPALPWVTPKDNRAKALASFESGELTLQKLIKDEAGGYAEWWAFYSFLIHGDAGRMRRAHDRMAKVINRGDFTVQHFVRLVGRVDRIEERFRAWLRANQQPLQQVWGYWQHTGDGSLLADCPRVGLSVSRAVVPLMAATVQPPRRAWKAGLVLAFRDDSNFVMAFVDSAANVLRVHRWDNRVWVIDGAWELPAREATAPVALRAQRVGEVVIVTVGGQEVVRVTVGEMPSRMGLVADTSRVPFTGVTWGDDEPATGDGGDGGDGGDSDDGK